jgi:hypothetical protein
MIVTGSHYQREWGIDISAGQVDAWLSGKYESFHEEKDAKLLPPQDVQAYFKHCGSCIPHNQ